MKKLCFIVLLISAVLSLHANDIEVTNLTAKEYQKKFDQLVQQGFRPVKVWSKTLGTFEGGANPSFGYWATFRKVPNSPAWAARHGIDGATYGSEFNKLVGQGYMPTDINVACVNNVVRYCVIYDKVPNQKPWVARHGINKAEFDAANSDLISKGYRRKLESHCRTATGSVYAALWQKN
jgi:hypothetical protein